ncbi:uncharacterized protein LOC100845434 [Brachypodium distachyon]|uniref:Uncharacterized protein n=1 Tax=Brachypodium distachyon TaxID=15368 RepID=A0A2K2DHS6_BRADI|nr:uncharacterized protein LOC100845434 [Brachypodium distachyon]PNT73836.1 hypothetical protein BRADI_1g02497v3 [Brachypodium distachyon]|eukprot:XP_003559185.1 uncharacterized protein LOC100845434 [Brachypodium distachyon]
MATRTTGTMVLFLFLLLAAAAMTATARDDLRRLEEKAVPPGVSTEKAPEGHLRYRLVTGAIEKVIGRSSRLDLEIKQAPGEEEADA